MFWILFTVHACNKFTHAPETQIIHGLLKCPLCMHLSTRTVPDASGSAMHATSFPKNLHYELPNSIVKNKLFDYTYKFHRQFTDSYVPRWLFCTLSYIATKVPIIYNGMPNPIVTCCLYTSTTGSLATFSHYTCSGKHFPIQVSIHNYKVHCYKVHCWFCYWPALFCLT